jgi:Xaa-Pro dipeptidase
MSGITVDVDSRPGLNPALFADNRARAVKRLTAGGAAGGLLVFGLPEPSRPLCDFEPTFRQESCFFWLTGLNDPDCAVYVSLATGVATLFYPNLPPSLEIWMGPLPTLADLKAKYGVDAVLYLEALTEFLTAEKPATVYSLEPTFRASLVKAPISLDFSAALVAIGEERQLKSAEELKLIQYACDVNSDAFYYALKGARPGLWAHQVEAILQHKYIDAYCRCNAFPTIVCTGEKCATLHYHSNDRKLGDGELVLVDAGCEYLCYAADNTRTFPANGRFSPDQHLVYQAVLDAHNAVVAAAKPGVSWPEMGRLSARVMAAGLLRAGLFKDGTPEEIVASGALEAFFPHGLGHGMGLDCHEIAGWEPGVERPDEFHVRRLRMGRTLVPGIVVTVEPGCYFVPKLYQAAIEDPKTGRFINAEVAERFRQTVGGVRIEDDLLITADGNRNLSHIPKEIADIEALMAK